MQTILSRLTDAFRAALVNAFGIDTDPLVSISQNEKFGDYQCNAAMGLAKQLAELTGQKTNPRQVAEQITARVQLGDLVGEPPTIAGPGFINTRLDPAWIARQLQSIRSHDRLGVDPSAHPQRIVVDYSGPNIAKEM